KVLWGAWNGLLLAALFVACALACGTGGARGWALLPAAALGNLAAANLTLGQLNPTAVVPATLGLLLLARRRDVPAGALVGLGAVVKFTPALLALWLATKRRWTALAALVATSAALAFGLPALVLGPKATADLRRAFVTARR